MSIFNEIMENPIRIGINSNSQYELRITLSEFKGKDYISIRKYYREAPEDMSPLEEAQNPSKIYLPTKKGINLTIEQFIQVMEKALPLYEELIKEE